MKRFSKTALLGATTLSASLIVSGAYAQEAEEPEENREVIYVTAQKREQTLQQTPVSVAVVTDQQIEQSQIRDAADIQTLVPGLRVAEFASSTNTEFNIRGIGTSSFNPGLEPSVGVFVDGVYRPRVGSAINDLISIERVEVIRGPQATLFGRNTPAGVVSIITKDPESEFGADGELTVGNYGQLIVKGSVTGPIAENLSFRFDASTHSNDGYLDNADGREFNNRDRQVYRGQLLWENGDTSLRIIADSTEVDENCCAAPFAFYDPVDAFALNALGATLLPPDPNAGQIAVNGQVLSSVKNGGISAELEHDFDGFTFTAISAWRTYDENQDIDADFTEADLVANRSLDVDYTSFTQEFRLTSTGDNMIDWMVGGFYYDNSLSFTESTPLGADARPLFDLASSQDPTVIALVNAFGLPAGSGAPTLLEAFLNLNNAFGVGQSGIIPGGTPSGNPIPVVPAEGFLAAGHGARLENYEYDTKSWSLFGQFDWHISDQLTFTFGGRYTEEDKDLATDIDIFDPISAFSFVDIARDLRVIDPGDLGSTCNLAAIGALGGDACAFLIPSLLLQQGQAEALAGDPTLITTLLGLGIDPTVPLTEAQAQSPLLNPLLGFSLLQNFPPVDDTSYPSSRSDDNFSFNAILSYDVSDTFNIYGSYSTGFKPGGFNLSRNAAFTGAFEFEEETASSWEIGAKGAFADGAFTYAAAYFMQEVEDFQSNNFVGNGFALENAGSIEVSGIEFEGLFAPTEGLVFTGGFTWLLESQYGDYEFAPCPDVVPDTPQFELCLPGNERVNDFGIRSNFNDLSGVDRGNSEFVSSLTGTYTFPIANNLEAFVRGEMTYVSDFFLTTSLDQRDFSQQDGFALYNASVGVGADDGAWGLQFWGRNIFEEEYVKGGFPSVGLLGNSYNNYPGDPATYGVTLRVRY